MKCKKCDSEMREVVGYFYCDKCKHSEKKFPLMVSEKLMAPEKLKELKERGIKDIPVENYTSIWNLKK